MSDRLRALRLAGAAALALAVLGSSTLAAAPATALEANIDLQFGGRPEKLLVVGHRGASGYRPEHTLASYELAARMGADYIEPDLVATKDGVLVARHENEISGTTDVADRAEFKGRKATKKVDGVELTGWFTEDFTLAELKTLRAKERIPQFRPNNVIYNGRFEVPTFQEVLDLRAKLSRELRRDIGVYPETKHPTYFRTIGLPLEPALVRTLIKNGLNNRHAKVFVQSFEVGNLKALSRELRVPLIQLLDSEGAPYDFVAAGDKRTYADLITPKGLKEIATYAKGIGPYKEMVIPRDKDGNLTSPTQLVPEAHRNGLKVHPYTFRSENNFLPANMRLPGPPSVHGNAFAEYEAYFKAGVDGVFADNPDTAIEARRTFKG